MNLIWQRLSSNLQITAKQWCIINERRMNRAQQVGASIGSHNPINPEGVAKADHTVAADRLAPVTGSSARLISIFVVETHTTLERIRLCAALVPANVASSALISVSNEPRRHFRVLLDRTESP